MADFVMMKLIKIRGEETLEAEI